MDTVEATGKTLDEALHAAAEQLGMPPGGLDYELVGEPKRILGVLGSGQYTVRAWAREASADEDEVEYEEQPADEPATSAEVTVAVPERAYVPPPAPLTGETTPEVMAERAREITARLMDLMGLEAQVRVVSADGEHLNLEIASPDAQGLLIGHHGDTLDSLQYLVTIGANAGLTGAPYRVNLDVEGYRARQAEALLKVAHRHADEAIASGREAVMPDLKSYERRLVHMSLLERGDVETYSEGEGLDRVLVISPLAAAPAAPEEPAADPEE